jgi:creatinine amidohydrolase
MMTSNSMAGAFLGDLSWEEAAELLPRRTVILPFSAGAKEHGPHLPLGTDRLVMDHLLEAAVGGRDVIVAPPILHGWFPAFREYPGTEVADPTVFQSYVKAVAESLIRHGVERLVILNMGITRATGLPLGIVARDLRTDEGIRVLVVSWDDLEDEESDRVYEQERGGHADEGETSIILHLREDLVRMDRAVLDYRTSTGPQIGYAPGKFDREAESGVYGDPTLATAEKGSLILEVMTRNFLEALDQFAG